MKISECDRSEWRRWGVWTACLAAMAMMSVWMQPNFLPLVHASVGEKLQPLSFSQMKAIRGGACKGCTEEWVSQNTLLGGQLSECDHGPETDPDCIQTNPGFGSDCSEHPPPPPGEDDPRNPDCKCYACGQAAGCERLIEYWRAWCGAPGENDPPPCEQDPCEIEAGTEGPVYRVKSQSVTGGGNCIYEAYEPGQDSIYIPDCGGPGSNAGGGSLLGCKTDSCRPSGAWITVEDDREKCK